MGDNGPDDYEPIDLAAWCNAGGEVLDDGPPIASGLRTYHGLPFLIGHVDDQETARFILLEPGTPGVVVPVGRPAVRVIVAHRRLPGHEDGAEPTAGDVVAEYAFDLEGRPGLVVPIRERFEVGLIPKERWDWDSPFLAVSAGTTEPLGRYQGLWEEAGLRQTEAPFRLTLGELFLWTWENPEPGMTLRSVRLLSREARILVAAITIANAPEHPFVRDAAVPVRISMTGEYLPCRAD